jgi:ABC-type transporter Mla MlaB component
MPRLAYNEVMTAITSLNRTTAATATTVAGGASTSTSGATSTAGDGSSTVVSLGAAASASATKALVWENRNRSTSASLMAQNFNAQPPASRLKGLGGELLKQVAYDGQDFSQTVQQAPSGVQTNTYDMLVAPSQVSQHGMGDNQVALTITTRSGVKAELKLDSGDNSIAVEAHADGELSEAERKALGKLSDAFQQAIDGLSEDPPRIDLSGLTQFDSGALASVDLKGQIKVNPKETQRLEFHADSSQRTLSFSGPAGSANIGVDLSQPASWGSKEQQAKALNNYLQQVDQAGLRGQGNGAMISMFKDAFSDMNSDYGTPAIAPRSIVLGDQDRAMTTGLADFTASFAQTEVASNPARSTEKDSFAYELSQKTSITGTSQLDRGITQEQQSHLKARYHSPVKAGAHLALDLSPQSQNYKYTLIDDSASSKTEIGYDQGVLAKASLAMQANQSSRVLKYTLGKLQEDHTTPSGKAMTRDLLSTLEPERSGLEPLSESARAQMLTRLNNQIFLRSNPDALPNEHS